MKFYLFINEVSKGKGKKFKRLRSLLMNTYNANAKSLTKNLNYWASDDGRFFKYNGSSFYLDKAERLQIGTMSFSKAMIIAKCFVPNNGKKYINFKNGKFYDIKASNLEWTDSTYYKTKFEEQNILCYRYKPVKKQLSKIERKENIAAKFADQFMHDYIMYAVEHKDNKRVFIGYHKCMEIGKVDLVEHLMLTQSWVANTVKEYGRSALSVKFLTLHNSKKEAHEMFYLNCAMYDKKGYKVMNLDCQTDNAVHTFIFSTTKTKIKKSDTNKLIKSSLRKKLKEWFDFKKDSFAEFDAHASNIEIPELDI